jgi:hypothetical protein
MPRPTDEFKYAVRAFFSRTKKSVLRNETPRKWRRQLAGVLNSFQQRSFDVETRARVALQT